MLRLLWTCGVAVSAVAEGGVAVGTVVSSDVAEKAVAAVNRC